MALAYSTTVRNGMLDQITSAIGASGLLRIYDGTRPASGGTATTLLAQLALSATSAPAASGGVLTFNAITQDSSADATGTATWFRVTTSGGTFVIDGSVGTSGSDLNMTTTSIVATQPVQVTSFVITEGNP
ncbi:MAG TPA: hypothetical protein PK317_06500 [Coprothermobacter proteolyticus]|nr:hypothetical protein [Coprothermobacter proteolyticus]